MLAGNCIDKTQMPHYDEETAHVVKTGGLPRFYRSGYRLPYSEKPRFFPVNRGFFQLTASFFRFTAVNRYFFRFTGSLTVKSRFTAKNDPVFVIWDVRRKSQVAIHKL